MVYEAGEVVREATTMYRAGEGDAREPALIHGEMSFNNYVDADAAVLGAPFDAGTQFRAGARFGPRAVREASTLFSFGHAGAYDHEDDVTYLPGSVRIVDMGDAVRARLNELDSLRPIGMELNTVSYQSDSVRAAVDGFVANLIAAVVIVVFVLVVFMGGFYLAIDTTAGEREHGSLEPMAYRWRVQSGRRCCGIIATSATGTRG